MMEKIQFQKPVMPGDPKTVCDFLAHYTELSKQKIKDAMKKGAVFLARPQGGRQRVRRATQAVSPGFEVLLFYDPAILNLTAPPAECMGDFHQYSVWYKPGGLLSQGSQWGDHCACLRQAELFFFTPKKSIFDSSAGQGSLRADGDRPYARSRRPALCVVSATASDQAIHH